MTLCRNILIATLLLVGVLSTPSLAQEPAAVLPENQGRRETWDFFSLLFALKPCLPHERKAGLCGGTVTTSDNDEVNGVQSSEYVTDTEEASTSTQFNERETAGGGGFQNSKNGLAWFLVGAVGSVVAAMYAVSLGQRKPTLQQVDKHAMAGSVNRRVGAVSALATGALVTRAATSGKTVELVEPSSAAEDSYSPYRLEVGPEGVEMEDPWVDDEV